MDVSIRSTPEEKIAVIKAINQLNDIKHIRAMSQAMIAECAEIKSTKIRAILIDLISAGAIVQYQVSNNKRVQRYYYVLTDIGRKYLNETMQ